MSVRTQGVFGRHAGENMKNIAEQAAEVYVGKNWHLLTTAERRLVAMLEDEKLVRVEGGQVKSTQGHTSTSQMPLALA